MKLGKCKFLLILLQLDNSSVLCTLSLFTCQEADLISWSLLNKEIGAACTETYAYLHNIQLTPRRRIVSFFKLVFSISHCFPSILTYIVASLF